MNRYIKSPKNIGEKEGSGKIMPDYIVVYGTASLNDIETAKRFGNIPIMEIDTNVYTSTLRERALKIEEHTMQREETSFMKNIKKSVKEQRDEIISNDNFKENAIVEKGDNYDVR